jgi:hypothetical protein
MERAVQELTDDICEKGTNPLRPSTTATNPPLFPPTTYIHIPIFEVLKIEEFSCYLNTSCN